jgi:hypothetical protein
MAYRTVAPVAVTNAAGALLTLASGESRQNPRTVIIYNNGPGVCYVGDSTVSTVNGIPVAVGQALTLKAWSGAALSAVSASTSDVRLATVD